MTDASLTLRARGPAEVETAHDADGITVRETHEVDLEAEIDVDADALDEHGSTYKSGLVLSSRDVAYHVAHIIDDDRTVRPRHPDDWELSTSGRIRDYIDVSVQAAKDAQSSIADDHAVATTAAKICVALDEVANGDRARLAALDLIEHFDVDDIDLQDVAPSLLDDGDVTAEATAELQEAEADD